MQKHSLARRRAWIGAIAALAGLACLACPIAALALDATYPTEQDLLGDLPVVLSGSRLNQRVDASPVAITVIDREMIKASGARTIEDLLRLAPGMIVGHASGTIPFATYHAMADRYARRMQVVVDGRSVYTPVFGGVPWPDLPLAIDDIERIEIIRGPNAAAYGANAFLGTISITTRPPGETMGGHAKLLLGNDGVNQVEAGYSASHGPAAYKINASTWGDNGFNSPIGETDNKQTRFITGDVSLVPSNSNHWDFNFGISSGSRTNGQVSNVTEPPHGLDIGYNYQQLRWAGGADPDNQLSVNFYREQNFTTDRFNTLPLAVLGGVTAPLNYDVNGVRYDLEMQQTISQSANVRTVWGVGGRVDEVRSFSYLGTPDALYNHEQRLFAHTEWHIAPKWLGNIGAMLEHEDIGGTQFSPRIALNYSFRPEHTLRISVSQADRTPVLIEQKANQRFAVGPVFDQVLLSSGGLTPEHINSFEIGYVGQLGEQDLWLDTRLFRDDIRDLITYFDVPYPDVNGKTQDFRNLDSLVAKGAEAQINWRDGDGWRVVGNYAYTLLHSTNHDEHYGESGPRHNFSVLVIHHLANGMDISGAYYFMSSYTGLDTGNDMGPTRRLDLTWRTPLGPQRWDLDLAVTVQGATGSYMDFRQSNIFDTRAFAQLNWRF